MTDSGKNVIKEIDPEGIERAMNTYQDYIATFVDGFLSNIFLKDIIDEVDMETLKKYFSNPDDYQKELENLAQYYYISNGEVFQLFEMVETLPTLNYKITAFDKPKLYDKYQSDLNKLLYKVKHKTLTRDILKQETSSGTLVGMWLGDSKNLYPYIFDNLGYIFPAYRVNGEWLVKVDLEWLSSMPSDRREIELANLKPYITENDLNNYQSNREKYRYKNLPQERAFVLRTHTLKRNQNLGTSWVTTGLFDVLHKKKLKDLEKSVANKIIKAIAILTVGSDKNNNEYANLKLPTPLKKKIHSGVKSALDKTESDGLTVITIPEFADLKFPSIDGGESLKSDKFSSINDDIHSDYGIGSAIINGGGSNFASAKINIDTIYKRIGVLLEEIEQEVYGKLFNLYLPKSQSDNFRLVYDKQSPLTVKEKIDVLMKLLGNHGFSVKAVIDLIDGVDFEDYIEDTLYEQDVLDLKNKIKPYMSAHTSSGKDNGGAPSVNENDITSEGTAKTKDNNGNDTPS